MSVQTFIDDLSNSIDKLFDAKHRKLAIILGVLVLLWMLAKSKKC